MLRSFPEYHRTLSSRQRRESRSTRTPLFIYLVGTIIHPHSEPLCLARAHIHRVSKLTATIQQSHPRGFQLRTVCRYTCVVICLEYGTWGDGYGHVFPNPWCSRFPHPTAFCLCASLVHPCVSAARSMRSRKLKQGSNGLLNGQYDDNRTGGRRQRPKARFLLGVAAGLLLVVWISARAHRLRSSSRQGTGWGLSRFWGETGSVSSKSSDGRSGGQAVARKDEKSSSKKKSKHHRHSNDDDLPVCTRSPLEQRQAYPMYGCAELEVSFTLQREAWAVASPLLLYPVAACIPATLYNAKLCRITATLISYERDNCSAVHYKDRRVVCRPRQQSLPSQTKPAPVSPLRASITGGGVAGVGSLSGHLWP